MYAKCTFVRGWKWLSEANKLKLEPGAGFGRFEEVASGKSLSVGAWLAGDHRWRPAGGQQALTFRKVRAHHATAMT